MADGTEAQDSVWSVRDQRYRDTQDSELSLTLLCYTDAQDHESTDQTSDCNAGEQQTPLKMCSVKLEDCRNLIESREEETTAEQQQQSHEEEQDNDWIDDNKEETKAQDSVWSVRDQRYRDTQDSELSLTLLCYTDAQDHESTDQTSDCNAGEQQTSLKMCSVKLVDSRNLIESREEETTAEQQQKSHEEEDQNEDDDFSTPKQSISKGDWEQSSMILTEQESLESRTQMDHFKETSLGGNSSEISRFFVLSRFLKSLKYNQI